MARTQTEIFPGTERDHSLSQFFTPPKLARKLVQWAIAGHDDGSWHRSDVPKRPLRVLEPSAGNGAIVRELVSAGAEVTAVEIDTRYALELAELMWRGSGHTMIVPMDFMAHRPYVQPFDLVCGNFPFHADLDGAFTLHTLEFAPRTCAIYPANVFYAEKRVPLWKAARPTRIAHLSKRPWPGATDYVALELVSSRIDPAIGATVTVEWWTEEWV